MSNLSVSQTNLTDQEGYMYMTLANIITLKPPNKRTLLGQ